MRFFHENRRVLSSHLFSLYRTHLELISRFLLAIAMYTLGAILLVIIIVGVAAFAPTSFSKRGGSSINMNFLSGLFGPKQTAVARHVSDSVCVPLPYGMPCKRHLCPFAPLLAALCVRVGSTWVNVGGEYAVMLTELLTSVFY